MNDLTLSTSEPEESRIKANELYRRNGLMKTLGIGPKALEKLMGMGLPHATLIGRQYFSGRNVIEWFESQAK